MPKKKVLTDAELNQTYEIVRGFNIPDGEGEKRYEPGSEKHPKFVTLADFDPDVWKALLKGDALKLVEDDTQPSVEDTIAAEIPNG